VTERQRETLAAARRREMSVSSFHLLWYKSATLGEFLRPNIHGNDSMRDLAEESLTLWERERESERERQCVSVSVTERERERERKTLAAARRREMSVSCRRSCFRVWRLQVVVDHFNGLRYLLTVSGSS
jgi:hypothetical protein